MRTFIRSHRVDDCLDSLEGIVVDVEILDLLAYPRNHRSQILDVTHLLDLLDLTHEIVEVELVLAEFLLQALSLFLVELLLSTLHKAHHVAHTEDSIRHTRWMEHVDGLHLLASTDELDRLRHHRANREGCTTAGVAIELREHYAIEIQTVVEFLCRVHSILTRHRVDHEQRLVWMEEVLQALNLVHHLLIDGQTTGGIDDYHVVTFGFSLLQGVFGNRDDVFVLQFRVDGNANLFSHHVQLLDSSRAIDVASHEQRLLVALVLQHIGEFARERGLTRTLQSRHQNNGRSVLELQVDSLTTHEFSQLVVHKLHHELSGLDGREHVHTHCLLLHSVGEGLCHLVVHVGIE